MARSGKEMWEAKLKQLLCDCRKITVSIFRQPFAYDVLLKTCKYLQSD